MIIRTVGRKVTVKDSFKQRAEKKLSKLDKFFPDTAHADVTVTVEKGRQTVEITVRSEGMLYRAEKTAFDMADALEGVVDSLVKQIVKNKSKLTAKLRKGAFDDATAEDLSEEEYQLVRTKTFDTKPMSVEEAMLQMNLLGHTFYVFLNSETETMNVVYKRNNGDYGLLVPETQQ